MNKPTNVFRTLFDIGFKRLGPVQIYDESSLDPSGEHIIPFDMQLAIVTHYIHTNDTDFGDSYREKGRQFIDLWTQDVKLQKKLKDLNTVCESPFQNYLFRDALSVPFPSPTEPKFTFIDLFAGIGGFRMAMQNIGGKCIFSSEWNPMAQKTYFANYGEIPFGDITSDVTKGFIPKNFDILCAGFPCQPFSIAGVSKKKSLGRETGFKDKTQGTLFFDVADIISKHRPKAFFLENVKNLTSHDKGYTFKVIKSTLEELGYSLHYKIMDGKGHVPQHRERIFIVGFNKDVFGGKELFRFPEQLQPTKSIKEILDENVDEKYTLSDKLWSYLQNYAAKHQAAGNGFGYGLVDLDGISRTLSARYYKDGSEILIPQGKNKNPRRLTPRECARLMGYPDSFIINAVSDVQAYKQFGNSVVTPLIQSVSEQIIKVLEDYERNC